jgi:hypothetical protein
VIIPVSVIEKVQSSKPNPREIARHDRKTRTVLVTRRLPPVENCGLIWDERKNKYKTFRFKHLDMVCVLRGGRPKNIRAKDAKHEDYFDEETGAFIEREFKEPILGEYRQSRKGTHQSRVEILFKGSQAAFLIWYATNKINPETDEVSCWNHRLGDPLPELPRDVTLRTVEAPVTLREPSMARLATVPPVRGKGRRERRA